MKFMGINLTAEQKEQLEIRHKSERDKYICDRIKAVLLRSENWSLDRISQALRLHKDSVRRHLAEYAEEEKLAPQNGGSNGKLNEEQTEELVAHVENSLYQKVADICVHVKAAYGINYTVSGMTWWLKQNLFVYKKPKEIPAKADEIKQKEFIKIYEKLKAEVPAKEPIVFMDSVHPTMETKTTSGWIRKGKDKQIFTTASRTRLNITGAINLKTMKVTHDEYETINGETTISFLKTLKKDYPKAPLIHVILDQSGYHRSEDVQLYAKAHRIKIHFLPSYSPNLNPIERLWKVMNEHARNNRFFSSAKQFRETIFEFFNYTLPKISSSLRSRINDNFHILKIASSF
jgi:transposase